MSKSALLVLLVALMGVAVQATSPHYSHHKHKHPHHHKRPYPYYHHLDYAHFYEAYKDVCPVAKVSCKAGASLNIKIYGPGSCYGKANAFCSAFAYSSGQCFKYDTLYIKGKYCRHIDATVDAKCYAAAAARAYTEAFGQIYCNGKYAFGCVNAYAEAHAIACAIAQALVDMNIRLGYNTAKCQAKIAVAIKAMAAAVARSQVGACSAYGKLGKVHDKDLGFAIQKVLAEAFAECWMYCDGKGIAAAQVTGGGAATVVVDKTKTIDDGGASTGGSPIPNPAPFSPKAEIPDVDIPGMPLDPRNTGPIYTGSKDTGIHLHDKDEHGNPIKIVGSADMKGFVKIQKPHKPHYYG